MEVKLCSLYVDYVVTLNENIGKKEALFVEMLQPYSEKTATIMETNAAAAYTVRVVLLHFTAAYRRFFMDCGYTIARLLTAPTRDSKEAGSDESVSHDQSV